MLLNYICLFANMQISKYNLIVKLKNTRIVYMYARIIFVSIILLLLIICFLQTIYPYSPNEYFTIHPSNEYIYSPIDNTIQYRTDTTTPSTTYTPANFEDILRQFIDKTKNRDDPNYAEFTSTDTIPSDDDFNMVVENVMVILHNGIYYDLFNNHKRNKSVMCSNFQSCRIIVKNKIVMRLFKHIHTPTDIRWEFILELMLENKAYIYQTLILADSKSIIDISVKGTRTEDIILPSWAISMKNKSVDSQVKTYLARQQMTSPNDTRIKNPDKPTEYLCYGSNGRTQVECELDYNTRFIPKNRGVWDKTCRTDKECPFFKSNKNYKNTFGGCNEGICEMPIGIRRLGNRYYDVDSLKDAECYNGNCSQQSNPDYRFINDIWVRKAYEHELVKNGFKIF